MYVKDIEWLAQSSLHRCSTSGCTAASDHLCSTARCHVQRPGEARSSGRTLCQQAVLREVEAGAGQRVLDVLNDGALDALVGVRQVHLRRAVCLLPPARPMRARSHRILSMIFCRLRVVACPVCSAHRAEGAPPSSPSSSRSPCSRSWGPGAPRPGRSAARRSPRDAQGCPSHRASARL
jgi:hypothetical protein